MWGVGNGSLATRSWGVPALTLACSAPQLDNTPGWPSLAFHGSQSCFIGVPSRDAASCLSEGPRSSPGRGPWASVPPSFVLTGMPVALRMTPSMLATRPTSAGHWILQERAWLDGEGALGHAPPCPASPLPPTIHHPCHVPPYSGSARVVTDSSSSSWAGKTPKGQGWCPCV